MHTRTLLAIATFALVALSSPPLAAAEPDIGRCLRELRAFALAEAQIAPPLFDAFVSGVHYDARLAEPSPAQPEFLNPTWEYVAYLVDAQRVDDGRAVLAQWHEALLEIERRTGVAPETVVALFGIETDFGRAVGSYPVLSALVNRACGPISATPAARAQARKQLYAAIQVLRLGDAVAADFNGSFAGAFGLTQFLPATYLAQRGQAGVDLADGDADGRVDSIHSVPDALMLTAKKLSAEGWRPGLPWALAVSLPSSFDHALVLRERAFGGTLYSRVAASLLDANRRSLAAWLRLGLQLKPAAQDLAPDTPFVLLSLNDDGDGPYLLASAQFEAHYRYNYSLNYAYAVGLLADRLAGRPEPALDWPSAERGLSRREIEELQCLMAPTHSGLSVDGRPGAKTRQAIADEENQLGWKPSGRTTASLLYTLRVHSAARAECSP